MTKEQGHDNSKRVTRGLHKGKGGKPTLHFMSYYKIGIQKYQIQNYDNHILVLILHACIGMALHPVTTVLRAHCFFVLFLKRCHMQHILALNLIYNRG